MNSKHYFLEKNWYKGNTHTHSTVSDGRLDPKVLATLYREAGYDFLAITDHDIYGIYEEMNTDNFIVLPGAETQLPNTRPGRWGCHHIVALGIPGKNQFTHGQRVPYDNTWSAQKLVDFLRSNGNLAVYAHPNWSHSDMVELESLKGILGMEIYNFTTEKLFGCGYSCDYYDQLLWKDKKPYCIASDDSHQKVCDYFGGFIMVNASALTHENIIMALLEGRFYASSGPLLYDIYREDGMVYIKCSPCRAIQMLSNGHPGSVCRAEEGYVTHASFKIPEKASYVRFVCKDAVGCCAWSNPIWF